MENKQTIRCNVDGCKYINDEVTHCTLDEIKVDSNIDDCSDKDETFCDSYEARELDDDESIDEDDDE